MKKRREFISKPVIDIANGKILGYIKDFITDENHKITGIHTISIHDNELYYLPIEHLSSIGRDAVLVNNLVSAQLEKVEDNVITGCTGALVMTLSGEVLGLVKDVVIDEHEGSISGYEISDGLLKDMVMGRKIISMGEILIYGDNVLIIADTEMK